MLAVSSESVNITCYKKGYEYSDKLSDTFMKTLILTERKTLILCSLISWGALTRKKIINSILEKKTDSGIASINSVLNILVNKGIILKQKGKTKSDDIYWCHREFDFYELHGNFFKNFNAEKIRQTAKHRKERLKK